VLSKVGSKAGEYLTFDSTSPDRRAHSRRSQMQTQARLSTATCRDRFEEHA
jgi:hypothetical protein